MNISFHYFAMRYLTCLAGFSDEDSQLVASTCQFINDNSQSFNVKVRKKDLTDEIKKRHLYEKKGDSYQVNMILTALYDAYNKGELKNVDRQKNRLIPYYYFPKEKLDYKLNNKNYEVDVISKPDENQIFYDLFNEAKKYYNSDSNEDKTTGLMMFGVLLHIASDSYVYNLFNGFESKSNEWIIKDVRDATTFDDLSEKYPTGKYDDLPAVGHVRVGNLINDWNVEFVLENKSGKVKYETRINNTYILTAARSMMQMMSKFLDQRWSESIWVNTAIPYLNSAFGIDETDVDKLITHWNSLGKLIYKYNSLDILDDFSNHENLSSYYSFLIGLDEIKEKAYYNLKLKESINMTKQDEKCKITIANPIFEKNIYTIKSNISLQEKYDKIFVTTTIFNLTTDREVSETHKAYKMMKNIGGQIESSIPYDDADYKMSISVRYGNKENEAFSTEEIHNFSIVGNKNLIKETDVVKPVAKHDDQKTIRIYNYNYDKAEDYYFAENANYESQEGNLLVDVFTPIQLVLNLRDDFSFSEVNDICVSLKDKDNNLITYCNELFVSKDYKKDKNRVTISLSDEWKNHILASSFPNKRAEFDIEVELDADISGDKEQGYRTLHEKYVSNENMLEDEKDGEVIFKPISIYW